MRCEGVERQFKSATTNIGVIIYQHQSTIDGRDCASFPKGGGMPEQ